MESYVQGGWVEFWVALVVFTFFFVYMGNIAYQHEQVRINDAKYKGRLMLKNTPLWDVIPEPK